MKRIVHSYLICVIIVKCSDICAIYMEYIIYLCGIIKAFDL